MRGRMADQKASAGANVDHPSVTLFAHVLPPSFQNVEGAADIHAPSRRHVRPGQLFEGAFDDNSGVVDDDVNAPEAADRIRHDRSGRYRAGDIADVVDGAAPHPLDLI